MLLILYTQRVLFLINRHQIGGPIVHEMVVNLKATILCSNRYLWIQLARLKFQV